MLSSAPLRVAKPALRTGHGRSPPRKSAGADHFRTGTNYLDAVASSSPFPTEAPFAARCRDVSALAERPLDMRLLRSRCFPQAAPTQASVPLRRVSFAFRRGLIARPYRIADIRRTSRRLATTRTTWASSSVSVVSRCAQAMPPDTLAIRERSPNTPGAPFPTSQTLI